jgi:hypothetical protein
MSTLMISRALLALVAPAGIAGILGSPATARTTVSGVANMKYTEQHALPLARSGSPVLLLNEASGTNRNTGKSDHMAGAGVINREAADLIQGNGPHRGYITLGKGADTTVSHWQGKIVTTPGTDQQPNTHFEGTWTMLSGTGKFDGATGSGSYEGQVLSPNEYTVEWSGEIELKQHKASR